MSTLSISTLSAIGLVIAAALPQNEERIVGGTETSIQNYPYVSALLFSTNYVDYIQTCVGNVLNNRAILTVAHCFYDLETPIRWRIRVGSSFANSGGSVHLLSRIITHPNFDQAGYDNDIAILHSVNAFSFGDSVRAARIAGVNYNPGDDQVVWNIGWGKESKGKPFSEQLRHLQVLTINYNTCKNLYGMIAIDLTENMMCSGWHDASDAANQWQGSSGGPVVHNDVIVGLNSVGQQYEVLRYLIINTKISRFTPWIVSNA